MKSEKTNNNRAGEMAQWLKECTVLAEDPVWILGPTSGGSQLPVTSAPGDLMPLQAPALTYTDTDIITGCRQSKACIQSGHGCAPEHWFLRAVK